MTQQETNLCTYNFPTRETVPVMSELPLQLLQVAKIPKRFWGLTLEDYNFKGQGTLEKVFKAYVANFSTMMNDACNLLIAGSNGTGKTMLASIILQEGLKRYYSGYYITISEYINLKFNSIDLTELTNCDILIIDELGAELQLKTHAEVVAIESLLKYREEKGLVTIICTNMEKSELSERYGNTVFSLLDSWVGLVVVGTDKRKDTARKTNARKILSNAIE